MKKLKVLSFLILSNFIGCTAAQAWELLSEYEIDFTETRCFACGDVTIKKGDLLTAQHHDCDNLNITDCDVFVDISGYFVTKGAKANSLSNDGVTLVRNILELNEFSQSPTGDLNLRVEDRQETGLRVKSASVSGRIILVIDKEAYPKVKAVYGSGEGHRDFIYATKIVFAPSNGEPATFGTFDNVEVRDDNFAPFPLYDDINNGGSAIFPRSNMPVSSNSNTGLVPYKQHQD